MNDEMVGQMRTCKIDQEERSRLGGTGLIFIIDCSNDKLTVNSELLAQIKNREFGE